MSSAPRICQTPGAIFLEGPYFRRFALYVYVPRSTRSFTLAIYDQVDDVAGDEASSFTLGAPDGRQISLDSPLRDNWSEYDVDVSGSWGVWQLRVEANSQDCRNDFVVKTVGEVDLYAKPEPCVSYRGALSFTKSELDSESTHVLTAQVPDVKRLRINFQLPSSEVTGKQGMVVRLDPPDGVDAEQRWVGMERDRFDSWEFWRTEHLEVNGHSLEGLWTLTLDSVHGMYHVGVEQDVRLFFTDTPLMPAPARAELRTVDAEGNPVAARVELSSTVTSRENYSGFMGIETPDVVFSDLNGNGEAFVVPGVNYIVESGRGFEFDRTTTELAEGATTSNISLHRTLSPEPGWYGGDTHAHSMYSDGSFTPVQVVEAARGEGLDWIVLTDHGNGHDARAVLRAHEEVLHLSEPGRFVVVPGEEFSADSFHANIFNGTVGALASDPLQRVIDVANEMHIDDHPMAVAWNHPYGHGIDLVGTELNDLPLVELWNVDEESQTTRLWWSWLNEGKRVFAETGTDSHHRAAKPYGARRTYVYLGDTELTADNVVRALKAGRSFLSQGALLSLTVNGKIPGSTVEDDRVEVRVSGESSRPVDRVEIIGNGEVVSTIDVGGRQRFEAELEIRDAKGWYLAQVLSTNEDAQPLALSNPVFVQGD